MKKSISKDLSFVVGFPLLVFCSVFLFSVQITYLTSLLLIFGVPSLYLSLKNKEKLKKVLSFVLLTSIPIALIFEIVTSGDKAWVVPSSILPWRLLGILPLEDYIWMFLTTYTIVIFYEHFCNKKFLPDTSKRIRVMIILLYSFALLAFLGFVTESSFLRIPFAYLWLGTFFFLIPVMLFLAKRSSFALPFLKVTLFFFYVHLLFELIGIRLGHWFFPGTNYVGWVSMLGLRFPLEEFFFVMILGAFAACTYYEYFTNRNLNLYDAQ